MWLISMFDCQMESNIQKILALSHFEGNKLEDLRPGHEISLRGSYAMTHSLVFGIVSSFCWRSFGKGWSAERWLPIHLMEHHKCWNLECYTTLSSIKVHCGEWVLSSLGTHEILAGSSSDSRNVPFSRDKMKFMAIPSPKSGEGQKCQINFPKQKQYKLSVQFE